MISYKCACAKSICPTTRKQRKTLCKIKLKSEHQHGAYFKYKEHINVFLVLFRKGGSSLR